jgi:hypothetical protein
MSEPTPEQPTPEPTTPPTPPTPEPNTPAPDSGEEKTDQEQGVGVAPTEPGDAGEGNPGTHFETTEEIEEKLGRTHQDVRDGG